MKTKLFTTLLGLYSFALQAQLSATFQTTLNTNCLGQPCNYEGPTILINELMISPVQNDGSISGPGVGNGRGEWIELYNPNLCEPVDISCYYLGNYTNVGSFNGTGGVRLPDNLIVPPGGFVMVRGVNVAPVPANLLVQNGGNVLEVVVPAEVWEEGVCSSSGRVWFPNVGGWFAFYDAAGVPQDAVSWATMAGTEFEPCVPFTSVCPPVTSLPSYNDIPENRKNYASAQNASNHQGQTIRRIPDGGPWTGTGAPTYATCNALPCAVIGESTCTGTATVNVTGGQAPYTYLWNDSQLQMTQTAVGLCGETYQVQVTDANGLSQTFSVTIQNFVPPVSLNVSAEYCVYEDDVTLSNYSPIPGPNETGEFTGTGVNGNIFSPGTAGVGTHTVTYLYINENGCTNSITNDIIVHPIPTITLNIANEYCVYVDPILISGSVTPPLNGSEGSGQLTGPGIIPAGLNTIFFDPEIAGVGTHTITYNYTSVHGCVNSVTDQIIVHPTPVVNLSLGTAFCPYDDPVNITLSGTPPMNDPSGSGVFSGTGVSLQSGGYQFDPEAAGPGQHTITYTFTSIHGCVNSDTDPITVHNAPDINFTADPTGGFTPISINFTNNSSFANNFTWYFGDGQTAQFNGIQISNLYTEAGLYTIVLVGEANGCVGSDSLTVEVFDPIVYDIPNVFSPNGDNINPVFNLINMAGFAKVNSFEFVILNRWGNVVRKYTDPYFGWDGKTEGGADAPEGVYFYKLNMTSDFGDEYENHGFFHLVRN